MRSIAEINSLEKRIAGYAPPLITRPSPSSSGMEQVHVLTSMKQPFQKWKRRLDLFCVLLSLPFSLPLMLLIALGIKLISHGPVLFYQERMGLGGERFICLKFRSMQVDAETLVHENYLKKLIESDRPMTKLDISGDGRLIPGGRFFRATGLDELPQLVNVLRGEMSLVGPRPCTPNEFYNNEQEQLKRLQIPPGLTGYWQVNGKNRTTFHEMIAMDIWYTNHLSLWLDLWIILKTPWAILVQIFGDKFRSQTRNRFQNLLK